MQNVNYFPWEETMEDNLLPTGVYQMRLDSMEDSQSSSGKRMFRAVFEVVAPTEYRGQKHFENFVTGNDEIPNGIVAGAMGTKNLKKVCKAAQVPGSNDINALVASLQGAELLAVVNLVTETKGDYAGQQRNRVADFLRVGERAVGLATQVAGNVPKAMVMSAPVAPMAPVMPSAPSAPVAPVAPAAPAAPVAPPAGGAILRCTICNRDVPIAEFGAHVQRHASDPGWDGVSA